MTFGPRPSTSTSILRSYRDRIYPVQTYHQSNIIMSPHAHIPALTTETINPAVLNVHYAVRGELALKADKYSQQLGSPLRPGSSSTEDLPFEKVVTANIGNPQQKGLDQVPITFWRQVISLLEYPDLMEKHLELAKQIYPEDVIQRAKSLYREIGSVGAYTHSKGVLAIRKRVAKFIEGELFLFWGVN